MTWTCPTCDRDYPDSGIGVPKDATAEEMEGCEVCWVSPAGTARYVRPDSVDNENEDDATELGDVMDYPDGPRDDDRRWIVLYPEDYENFGRDPEGNLAVLVNQEQAGEVLSLTAQIIASLSSRDAEGDDVLRDMRDALDRQIGNGDADV